MSYLIRELYRPVAHRRMFYLRGTGVQFDQVRKFLSDRGWILAGRCPSYNRDYDWMCYITFPEGRGEEDLDRDCREALAQVGVPGARAGGQPRGASADTGPEGQKIDIDSWEESLLRWLESYFSQDVEEEAAPELDARAVYQHLRLGELFEAEDLINKYVEDGGDPREVAGWRAQLYAAMERWPEVEENLSLNPDLIKNPVYAAWGAEAAYNARRYEDVPDLAQFALGALGDLPGRDEDEERLFRRMQLLLARSYNRLGQPDKAIQYLVSYLRICWEELDELDREDYLDELEEVARACLGCMNDDLHAQARRGLLQIIKELPPEAGRVIRAQGLDGGGAIGNSPADVNEVASWEEVKGRWEPIYRERPYEAVALLEEYIESGVAAGADLCRAKYLLAKTYWLGIRDGDRAAQILEGLLEECAGNLGEEEALNGLRMLIKHRFSQGNLGGVLELSEAYLSRAQHGEVLALRGLALNDRGGREEEAINCLEKAERLGYVTADTCRALGGLLADRDPPRAKEYYRRILEEKWNDGDALQMLLLLEDDPRAVVSLCEEFIARLETPGQAAEHIDVFQQRIEALLKIGDQAGLAQAICDLAELYLEQGQWDGALSLYRRAKEVLGDKYHLLEVLDSLELAEQGWQRE